MKATIVQFNFVAFDDLVPYLPRFRQTFPNVESFEFIETDIRTLNQLNALSMVQGLTALNISAEGNPITLKGRISLEIESIGSLIETLINIIICDQCLKLIMNILQV